MINLTPQQLCKDVLCLSTAPATYIVVFSMPILPSPPNRIHSPIIARRLLAQYLHHMYMGRSKALATLERLSHALCRP